MNSQIISAEPAKEKERLDGPERHTMIIEDQESEDDSDDFEDCDNDLAASREGWEDLKPSRSLQAAPDKDSTSIFILRKEGSGFGDDHDWEVQMTTMTTKVDARVPRTSQEMSWRLALAMRHRGTIMSRFAQPSFVTWHSLAEIFQWSSGPAFQAYCRGKAAKAFDNNGLDCINLLAFNNETVQIERSQISD